MGRPLVKVAANIDGNDGLQCISNTLINENLKTPRDSKAIRKQTTGIQSKRMSCSIMETKAFMISLVMKNYCLHFRGNFLRVFNINERRFASLAATGKDLDNFLLEKRHNGRVEYFGAQQFISVELCTSQVSYNTTKTITKLKFAEYKIFNYKESLKMEIFIAVKQMTNGAATLIHQVTLIKYELCIFWKANEALGKCRKIRRIIKALSANISN